MAYAIHIDILTIMLWIKCHKMWTELQPGVAIKFSEMYENAGGQCEWR